ncbi:MAG: peptidoglycan-associated lipoprotein Pal [Gemmatimonadota bacterium]|nr:peptidoglycan-associated lipoprotein Pal [Gemmatimonadota bacterium]MDQ6888250.1 peptidoglycan-associated lipoprotein Pal [Gemmatimonadota bacterium]
MSHRHRPLLTMIAATIALTACPKKPVPAPAPVPTINQDSINRERARQDSMARAEQMRRDSAARAQAETDRMKQQREAALAQTRSTLTANILFEYDSDALSDAARSALDQKVAILAANVGVHLRVAGHTDERGSDEYNLALGQRRAAAAKRYLSDHGVDASRLDIISYGEERPAAPGHDEAAWAQNRRAEFEITAGGDQITAAARP